MSSDHQSADRGVNDDSLEIVVVAALDEQRVIGRGGELPWRLPADLRHFKQVTMGHPIIMGRKTYESIGRSLPGRRNIILSRREGYDAPGCIVASSLEVALEQAAETGTEQAMIIGGAGIFCETLPRARWLVLTVVHDTYEGDTYFPCFDSDQWEMVECRFHDVDEKNESAMSFVRLRATVDEPRHVEPATEAGPLPEILRFDARE